MLEGPKDVHKICTFQFSPLTCSPATPEDQPSAFFARFTCRHFGASATSNLKLFCLFGGSAALLKLSGREKSLMGVYTGRSGAGEGAADRSLCDPVLVPRVMLA